MMDFFYIAGNVSGNMVAAVILLVADWRTRSTPEIGSIRKDPGRIVLSRDVLVMRVIGAWLRVYWGMSPPSVWDLSNKFYSLVTCIDVLSAPLLWMLVWWRLGSNALRGSWCDPKLPWYVGWPFLSFLSVALGLPWLYWGPYQVYEDDGFPYAMDVLAVSFVLDGLAFLPQMFALSQGKEGSASNLHPCIGHFVGALSLCHCLRTVSYAVHLSVMLEVVGPVGGTGRFYQAGEVRRVLLIAIPDLFHSIMVADFVYMWSRKVKEQSWDRWIQDLNSAL